MLVQFGNNWFQKILLTAKLQLTSPYGHLSITDSSFGHRNAKNQTFSTSIIWTPL